MIRRKLNREEYENDSYTVWNSYVDLLAMEEYGTLSKIQKNAHLVFWYYSEVTNGGHLQYFVNETGQYAKETIVSLGILEMYCHRKVLKEAYSYLLENPIDKIDSAIEFVNEATEGNFNKFDKSFHECSKEPNHYLQIYLEENFQEFIEVN